jgi:hypothetical protein
MVQRRAIAAGITTKVGNHTFRATGITALPEKIPVHILKFLNHTPTH